MQSFSFAGNMVGALGSANDDGTGGVNLELDIARNLSGGNPWYASTDVIEISIKGSDIGPDGEFIENGGDNKVTVNWIKVNGVKITTDQTTIKFGGGTDTYDSDAFFYVEGIDLVFLAPQAGITFDDTDISGSPPILNIPERVADIDLNEDGDTDDANESGNGIFDIEELDDGDATEYLADLLGGMAGTHHNDILDGSLIDDTISGGSGNDEVAGGAGDDLLFGDLANEPLGLDATPINNELCPKVGDGLIRRRFEVA